MQCPARYARLDLIMASIGSPMHNVRILTSGGAIYVLYYSVCVHMRTYGVSGALLLMMGTCQVKQHIVHGGRAGKDSALGWAYLVQISTTPVPLYDTARALHMLLRYAHRLISVFECRGVAGNLGLVKVRGLQRVLCPVGG